MKATDFATQMAQLTNDPDAETAHIEADNLLTDMLRSLAPLIAHLEEDHTALLAGLDDYEKVGKWYA